MIIPTERWHDALKKRHSVRSYRDVPLDSPMMESLEKVCADFSGEGVQAVIVTEHVKDVFRGVIGPYGMVKGAPLYVALICDGKDPHGDEKTGYAGEAVVLEMTALGLGTCWIGGLFDPKAVLKVLTLKEGEKIPAVIPVGFPAEKPSFDETLLKTMAKSHTRKDLDTLVSGMSRNEWPLWATTALEAARIAPSALNRQPWRFIVEERCITVTTDQEKEHHPLSKRLDCGIAMLHLEVGARKEGAEGRWEYLEAPEVARYRLL